MKFHVREFPGGPSATPSLVFRASGIKHEKIRIMVKKHTAQIDAIFLDYYKVFGIVKYWATGWVEFDGEWDYWLSTYRCDTPEETKFQRELLTGILENIGDTVV